MDILLCCLSWQVPHRGAHARAPWSPARPAFNAGGERRGRGSDAASYLGKFSYTLLVDHHAAVKAGAKLKHVQGRVEMCAPLHPLPPLLLQPNLLDCPDWACPDTARG